jgi:hypothetical protein
MKRTDKRRHNPGRPNEGKGEASTLVRGPAELMEAMERLAGELGLSIAETWRRAALAYLGIVR